MNLNKKIVVLNNSQNKKGILDQFEPLIEKRVSDLNKKLEQRKNYYLLDLEDVKMQLDKLSWLIKDNKKNLDSLLYLFKKASEKGVSNLSFVVDGLQYFSGERKNVIFYIINQRIKLHSIRAGVVSELFYYHFKKTYSSNHLLTKEDYSLLKNMHYYMRYSKAYNLEYENQIFAFMRIVELLNKGLGHLHSNKVKNEFSRRYIISNIPKTLAYRSLEKKEDRDKLLSFVNKFVDTLGYWIVEDLSTSNILTSILKSNIY